MAKLYPEQFLELCQRCEEPLTEHGGRLNCGGCKGTYDHLVLRSTMTIRQLAWRLIKLCLDPRAKFGKLRIVLARSEDKLYDPDLGIAPVMSIQPYWWYESEFYLITPELPHEKGAPMTEAFNG